MNWILFLVAVALVVVSQVLPDGTDAPHKPHPNERNAEWGGLVLALLVAGGLALKFLSTGDRTPFLYGLGASAIVTALGSVLKIRYGTVLAAAVVPVLTVMVYVGTDKPMAGFCGILIGSALASLCFARERWVAHLGFTTAIATSVVLFGSMPNMVDSSKFGGPVLWVGMAVIGTILGAVPAFEKASVLVRSLIDLVLLLAFTIAVSMRYLSLDHGWICAGLGVVSGFVIHQLVPADDDLNPTQSAIATMIWIGLGTLAYSYERSLGMALSLACGIAFLTVAGNLRATLTAGPLLALTLYREYSGSFPTPSRTLDITQHYVLIGLSMGAVLPTLIMEWLQGERKLRGIHGALWGLVMVTATVLFVMVFGLRGAIGLITGLGFGSLAAGWRLHANAVVLSIPSLAAGVLMGGYWVLAPLEDMARDEKIRALAYGATILLILAGAMLAIGRPSAKPQQGGPA